jgi:hypothetical protein
MSIDAYDGRLPILALMLERGVASPAPDGLIRINERTIARCWDECSNLAQGGTLSEIGEKALRLSRSYDNWFLSIRPLDAVAFGPRRESKAFKQLNESVEEASGGIRLGAFNEFHFEIVMRTAEDAAAVVTLAKWFPALADFEAIPYQHEIFNLAEDLNIQPHGRTVSVCNSRKQVGGTGQTPCVGVRAASH